MSIKKRAPVALGVAIVAAVAIQFYPVEKTNPPGGSTFDGPPAVAEVLRRACYNCHSYETAWPWYSQVAPVSWWIADHVEEGREHLNFAKWDQIPAGKRAEIAQKCWEEVREGHMPLRSYRWGHPEARLSAADRKVFEEWAAEVWGTGHPASSLGDPWLGSDGSYDGVAGESVGAEGGGGGEHDNDDEDREDD